MNPSPRTTSRLPHGLVVLIFTLLVVLFIWLISFCPQTRILPFALAGQAYLIIAVILAFRYWPPMTHWLRIMPVPHRIVFGLILGGLILGHLTQRSSAYYPFTAWGIFSDLRHDDPVYCREFIATTKSGREVRLLVEQEFPSIVQIWPIYERRFSSKLVDRLAEVLTKTYNATHPDDPAQQVDLMLVSIKLKPDPGDSQIQPTCQLIKRYDFSSGR